MALLQRQLTLLLVAALSVTACRAVPPSPTPNGAPPSIVAASATAPSTTERPTITPLPPRATITARASLTYAILRLSRTATPPPTLTPTPPPSPVPEITSTSVPADFMRGKVLFSTDVGSMPGYGNWSISNLYLLDIENEAITDVTPTGFRQILLPASSRWKIGIIGYYAPYLFPSDSILYYQIPADWPLCTTCMLSPDGRWPAYSR